MQERRSSERWSEPERRPQEQGLDRLVSAGRQLMDGVSGARPGARRTGRSGVRPRLGELGRWVEDRLEWILEDEDDWREPWQEPPPGPRPSARLQPRPEPPAGGARPRRPLEAVSRRGSAAAAPAQPPSTAAARPLPRSSRRRQPD